MVKTGFKVEVPLKGIFHGKAKNLIETYGGLLPLTQSIGNNSAVNATLREILTLAGVKTEFKVTFHTSRHTFATLLLQNGTPMEAIQQMLGHRKIETTQIYGERDRQSLKKQLKMR